MRALRTGFHALHTFTLFCERTTRVLRLPVGRNTLKAAFDRVGIRVLQLAPWQQSMSHCCSVQFLRSFRAPPKA